MNQTIHRPLLDRARLEPDRPAVRDRGRTVTYGALADRAYQIAAHAVAAGVRPGDRVGLYCGKTVDQVAAIYGLSLAGAIVVFLNALLRREQVEEAARNVGMTFLVLSPEKLKLVGPELAQDLPFRGLLTLRGTDDLPAGLRYPVHTADGSVARPTTWPRRIAEDPACIIFTSGSTGRPKGAVLSHRHLRKAGAISVEHLFIRGDDRILNVLPLSFDYGLGQLQMCLEAGATFVLHTYLTPAALVHALHTEQITVVQLTPVVYGELLTLENELRENPPQSVRLLTNSGAHLPRDHGRRLRGLFSDADLVLMYGMTETFRSTYLPPEEFDRRPDSMGKAVPDVEVLVLNEQGQPCKPGEIGELVHRGTTRLLGYWGDPVRTAERLRPHPFSAEGIPDAERVVYTGDLVRTDEDGFLYFVGRRDFLIKSMGYRIGPEEVEDALLATGLIREAGVHGVPDEKLGQRIRAHVVPKNPGESAEAIRQAVAPRLPRYMVPHEIVVRITLPHTLTGKVDRKALMAEGSRT